MALANMRGNIVASATGQNIDSGAMRGAPTTDRFVNAPRGENLPANHLQGDVNNVGSARWVLVDNVLGSSWQGSVSGFASVDLDTGPQAIRGRDFIQIVDLSGKSIGVFRVLRANVGQHVVINADLATVQQISSTPNYIYVPTGSFGTQSSNPTNFLYQTNSATLIQGTRTRHLNGGANRIARDAVHRVKSMRKVSSAKGIRQGHWNPVLVGMLVILKRVMTLLLTAWIMSPPIRL